MTDTSTNTSRAVRRVANLTFVAVGVGFTLCVVWIIATVSRSLDRPLHVTIDPLLAYQGGAPAFEMERPTPGIIVVRERTSRVAGYFRETEFVVTTAKNGLPQVEVRAVSKGKHSGEAWPFEGLGGTVRLSSATVPARDEPPLVIAYELTGDCGGSPVDIKGAVVAAVEQRR